MPTVVLLDISLSSLRPIALSATQRNPCRLDVLIKGVSQLVARVQHDHPLEPLALVTYATQATLAVPFTTKMAPFATALNTLQVGETTDLTAALETAVEHARETWPDSPGTLQFVVFTDGRPSRPLPAVALPLAPRVHVVALGRLSDFDHSDSRGAHHSGEVSAYGLTALAHRNRGSAHFVSPAALEASASMGPLLSAVDAVVSAHFQMYSGVLRVGALECPIRVSPDPDLARSDAEGSRFPQSLSLRGVIPSALLPAPPTRFRGLVLPNADHDMGEARMLPQLLQMALAAESLVGLVVLAEDQCALLSSYAPDQSTGAGDQRCGLLLTVLDPDVDVPWLGNLAHLIAAPDSKSMGLVDAELPLPMPFSKSYNVSKPSHNLSISPSWFQSEQTRLRTRVAECGTDKKRDNLFADCERIRLSAMAYQCPDLVDEAMATIRRAATDANLDNRRQAIITDLLTQLEDKRNNPYEKVKFAAAAGAASSARKRKADKR